tara:strand:- start:1360 stop:1512 length:153 start_codon:yes stop_codon:yes gene_type:complete
MQSKLDFISFNAINGMALSFTIANVETVLTLLVLLTALLYNIKKLTNNDN